MEVSLYPAQTGCKTSTINFGNQEQFRWEVTARKCPIGSTNHPWKKAPRMEVSLYPAQTGCKTSTINFGNQEQFRWEVTARKCPIGSTNHP
ncbi:hypothetical protein CQJ30_06270 [Caldibacillus thermoamylovorans]|nr:hypothetical protein CQJ30_06270 [Caldibacillus thermoamylovorans]